MMGPEEGEIYEPNTNTSADYDPSYEWPGENPNTTSNHSETSAITKPPAKLRPNQPTFRLIVLRTAILPSKHRLAVIDGHSEIQFGRDVAPLGSTTPRVRLKEMEVSKLHATAYWDAIRREWGVVDMGSVHGTFLCAASVPEGNPGMRLSPPRQASIPRKLNHLDRLTIGSTTFLVHLHADHLPCEECWTSSKDEIPLFAKSSKSCIRESSRINSPALDSASSPSLYTPNPPKDPKKALNTLKQLFLTRHSEPNAHPEATKLVDQAPSQYLDRSARRRSLMPASRPDTPGVSPVVCPTRADASTESPRPRSPVPQTVSQPPIPLQSSNIGYRLLMKQGWELGTAVGLQLDQQDGRTGLVEPIQVKASVNRGGLGLKRSSPTSQPDSDPNWKEAAKRRRWEGF